MRGRGAGFLISRCNKYCLQQWQHGLQEEEEGEEPSSNLDSSSIGVGSLVWNYVSPLNAHLSDCRAFNVLVTLDCPANEGSAATFWTNLRNTLLGLHH
jgi:hypothetical protein